MFLERCSGVVDRVDDRLVDVDTRNRQVPVFREGRGPREADVADTDDRKTSVEVVVLLMVSTTTFDPRDTDDACPEGRIPPNIY